MVGGDKIRDIPLWKDTPLWKSLLTIVVLLSFSANIYQWCGANKAIRIAEDYTKERVAFEQKMNAEFQARFDAQAEESAAVRKASQNKLTQEKKKYARLRTIILSIPIPPKKELEEILEAPLGEIEVDGNKVTLSKEDFQKFELAVVDLGEERGKNVALLIEIDLLNEEIAAWQEHDRWNRALIGKYKAEVKAWEKAARGSKLRRAAQYGVVIGAFVVGIKVGGG